MIDKTERGLAAMLFLLLVAAPCLAGDQLAGVDRKERIRLSQDYPAVEYMVRDDFPLLILAPSWAEIKKAAKDSKAESGACVMEKKTYGESLQRQLADADDLKQKFTEFSQWLKANGAPYLDEAFRRGYPMRTVLVPFCVEKSLQGGLNRWDESVDFASTFWVALALPTQPRSFQEQFPVIFHEWGHYVFHRMMEESVGHAVLADEAATWLNPLDEGFADFVSYAFLGAPAHIEPPMRTPLSSSLSDRRLVLEGKYPYFKSEDHSAGEPFRDVLIRVGAVYGAPVAMQVARDIAAEILSVQRKTTGSPEKAANAAVAAVFERRAIPTAVLLQQQVK